MYKRLHHQYISKIIESLDCEILQKADCYFGGGTAISLMLNEYRESVDIDFLCGSDDGYAFLMENVFSDLGPLFQKPVDFLREPRVDRDAIRSVIKVEDVPIKFEIIRSGRKDLMGEIHPKFKIPTLSQVDLYSEKLCANAGRGLDKAFDSRDIIDLSMMIQAWGHIPEQAWVKAFKLFKKQTTRAFYSSSDLINNSEHLAKCLRKMHMDKDLIEIIPKIIENEKNYIPLEFQLGFEQNINQSKKWTK